MAKTLEDQAKGLKKGVDSVFKTTETVADTANKGFETVTGHKSVILNNLGSASSSAIATNADNLINVSVAGATTATTGNQLLTSLNSGDLLGITDALANGATSVNDLMTQLNALAPAIPKVQLPVQITASLDRLKNGKDVYEAAGAVLTALVSDASGGLTLESIAALTSHLDQNWDTFSAKIDALFQVTPSNGQQAVLETIAKSLFGTNVYNAASVIKRQVPGVLSGIVGVKEAINQFGGSYRDPVEAATKIRNGVEKMVQSIEKISQSLNDMVKFYQGRGNVANGQGFPLLDALGSLSGTKGIKMLDTALRIGGGAAAVAGNAGALAQAIKNKDVKGAVEAAKKAFDDFKTLTKKGKYSANSLTTSSGSQSSSVANKSSSNNQPQQSKNENNQSSLGSPQANSYVCSGATMKCTMGTSTARLTVLPIRTVFLTGQPMANISDHLTMVNLAPFGRCRSLGFPATAAATAAHHGHLTPMPCMHNTPFPWMNGKNDYIVKGDPALLKSSICQCMWGGTISLVTDGQTPTDPADMSRKPSKEFDRNQYKEKKRTISLLTQIGLQAKPLLTDNGKGQKQITAEHRALLDDKKNTGKDLDKIAASLVGESIPRDYSELSSYNTDNPDVQAIKSMSKNEYDDLFKKVKRQRMEKARAFYDETWPRDKHGMRDEAGIYSHLNGIDFNHPIEVVELPPPNEVYQFLHKGSNKAGSYTIIPPIENPEKYGIHGKNRGLCMLQFNDNTPKVRFLKSTASNVLAPLDSDWRSDRNDKSNWIRTEGGGIQLYSRESRSSLHFVQE